MASDSETPGKSITPGAVLAILANAEAGAAGEAILASVAIIDGDPSKRDVADLALIGRALSAIGAQDAAAALALEATGYWKAAK
jgi:hypothetical protein